MKFFRTIKKARSWAHEVNIDHPPATESDLLTFDNVASAFMLLVIALVAFILFAIISLATGYFSTAIPRLAVGLLSYLSIFLIIKAWGEIRLISEVDDNQTLEIFHAINKSKSKQLQRYAKSVRKMGRPYRVAELFAIKNYDKECAARRELNRAKSFLYDEFEILEPEWDSVERTRKKCRSCRGFETIDIEGNGENSCTRESPDGHKALGRDH